MAIYSPKRKISEDSLEEVFVLAKADEYGRNIAETYLAKEELEGKYIPVIETSATSADDLPTDVTAYYRFSSPVSVTVQGATLYYDTVLCIQTAVSTIGTKYIQIMQGVNTGVYYECYRSKYAASDVEVSAVSWSAWQARDFTANSSYAGLMSASNYNKLNAATSYLKYYYLNGIYHYIGGQGSATHSSGKYQHIGRYITGGTISGTAEVYFTNCSGKITVTGADSKVYIENSPNLIVTQQTSGNVFINGAALIYDMESSYSEINKGYPSGIKVGDSPSFTDFGYDYYIVKALLADPQVGAISKQGGAIVNMSGSGNYYGFMYIYLGDSQINPYVSREWEAIGTGSDKSINVYNKNSAYYISKMYGVKR